MHVYSCMAIIKRLYFLLLFLLITGTVLGVCFNFFDFFWIKSKLDALATDGEVESFTILRFKTIQQSVLILTICLAILTSFLIFRRKKLIEKLAITTTDFAAYFSLKSKYLKQTFFIADKKSITVLFLIFLSGITLRLNHLMQPINYDEAFSFIYFINRPLYIALSDYSYPNNHLFHTFLSHVSTGIFGDALGAIRLPALIAGIFIPVLVFFLGRKVANKQVGLLAAAACAVFYPLVGFSVLARGYTLVTFFFLLCCITAIDVTKMQRGASYWFALLAVLGVYTVPVFIPCIVIAILLARQASTATTIFTHLKLFYKAFLLIGMGVFVLYLPPLLVSGSKALLANDSVQAVEFANWGEQWLRNFNWLISDWKYSNSHYFLVPIVCCFLLALFFNKSRALILNIILVVIAFSFTFRNVPPSRTLLQYAPLLILASAWGFYLFLSTIKTTQFIFAFYVFVVMNAICVFNTPPAYMDEIIDAEPIALFLKQKLKPNDHVMVDIPTDYSLEYYFMKHDIPVAHIRKTVTTAGHEYLVFNEASRPTDSKAFYEKMRNANAVLVGVFKHSKIYVVTGKVD